MITLHTISNPQEGLQAAGKALEKLLRQSKDKQTLLLLAGGSCLPLVNHIHPTAMGSHLTVTMVDERYSRDGAVNNFLQLTKTDGYKAMKKAGVSFIETVPQHGESLEDFAWRYEDDLRQWRDDHADGVIVATMGIGADGHTSGILPFGNDAAEFERLFVTTERWVVGYEAIGKHEHALRATTTILFLKTISAAIVYAYKKPQAMERVVAKQGTLAQTPARVLHEMKQVHVFTDVVS